MADHCGTFEAARLLGLSVGTVQSLVEQGELSAWKTPGGHRRIYLESIERYRHRHGKGAPTATPTPAEGALTVLVVEDDEVTLAVMKAAMEKWQLPVDCVFLNSGVKALLEIGALRPQVLITDLKMPGVDGFDLVATLDRDPLFASLLIVAVTSMTAEDIRLKGGLPARVQVLPKPVNLPWLQGFLSALVAQRRLSAQAAAPAPAAGPRPA
jgi:excisionase family DNA binding protein